MRAYILLLLALCHFEAQAQKLTENSVVKDSSGVVYPVAIWKALLMKGSYALKAEDKDDPNTAFLLVRLTDSEKESRLGKMPPPDESKFFRKGEKITLGKVADINGNKLDLKNNAGKITVINFWFINCPPCRMEIPDLNDLADKYGSDSVRFVAVALDEKYALEKFLQDMPFRYHVIDNGGFLAQDYNIRSFPTHVILDQQGKVYFHTTGLSVNTVYWMEKCIKELLHPAITTIASAQ
ncbi:MAG: TlpA family protein disulfide reductase [Bacteroidota bacterium]|nr:TlpA family protein disulfide reductase [Bacteroidota bacterium]